MNINISINGVLRNFIQKFEYHFNDYYLNHETGEEEEFNYNVNYPIHTIDDFNFQSKDERNIFTYIEFPLEIFGHAGLTESSSISDINKIIFENKNINFTFIGLDEFGKAKPSTLFFLSKNGFLGNNIKFISSDDIKKEWKKCDIWITDDENIIKECPSYKKCYKFNTQYNNHFTYVNEINNLKEIEELCLKLTDVTIMSTLTQLAKYVKSNLKLFWVKMVKRISQV